MYRIVPVAAAALIVWFAAAGHAVADDRATCGKDRAGDEGIAACSRLIKRNPKDATSYANRGDAYLDKNETDLALADYNQAIRLDPTLAYAYGGRGMIYGLKGEYDRALADHDEAIRLDPASASAYKDRGYTYFLRGEYDRAFADADQAIKLDPKYSAAWSTRGEAYMGKGDYDRAIADLDSALMLDPKDGEAYSDRGYAYGRRGKSGDRNRAMADLDKGIALDPKFARSYGYRAAIHGLWGDTVHAMADADRAIRLNPKDAFLYNVRGEIYLNNGQYAPAIADYDEALRLKPDLAEARQGRESAKAALAPRPEAAKPVAVIPQSVALPQVASPPPSAPPPVATPDAVSPPAAPPSRRVALVIGMSAYANAPPLRNPARDARAVAAVFRRLGFAEVIEREDLTRSKLEDALKEFGDKAAEADWAVIYYAGHGVELNGENYLVPVDAKLARADHVDDETVTLKRVLSKAATARQLRMVILDACRNNPFRMASADGRTRAVSRGLSPVVPVRGVLVAYAARDGTTADDGDGEHSPFTAALLSHLETPGLDIRIMFGKVHDTVMANTNDVQEPYTYGALPGQEFYFKQVRR
jgi:tetratricopeptide (TPR) repeat protein